MNSDPLTPVPIRTEIHEDGGISIVIELPDLETARAVANKLLADSGQPEITPEALDRKEEA